MIAEGVVAYFTHFRDVTIREWDACKWLIVLRGQLNFIRRENRFAATHQPPGPEYHAASYTPEPPNSDLEELIAGLTPQERAAIVGRYELGRTFAELTETLGVSRTTVYRTLTRAVEKLRHESADR